MRIYTGTVNLIGNGVWENKLGGGRTTLSVLEIGVHAFKNIILTDYLANYLRINSHATILVYHGLTQGLITRPVILGVEINGKKYKENAGLLVVLTGTKVAFFCFLFYLYKEYRISKSIEEMEETESSSRISEFLRSRNFHHEPTLVIPKIILGLIVIYYAKQLYDYIKF